MKLVEIIRGLATADEVYEAVEDMTMKLSKMPVEVNDFPGFVANRILMPMINEAIYTLYEGVATKEAIDEVMKLGMNHPMGPLATRRFHRTRYMSIHYGNITRRIWRFEISPMSIA